MEERIPLKNITDEHADAFADICKFKKDQPKSPLQNAIDRKAEARRILTDEKTGSHFMGEWRNLIEGLKFLYINGYDIPLFYNITASPPSMPEPTVEEALKEYYKWYGMDSEPHKEDEGYENRKVIAELMVNFANQMRSQCDGLIKHKAVEFAEWASGKDWKYIPEKQLWQLSLYTGHYKTTEELYEIFNQQER